MKRILTTLLLASALVAFTAEAAVYRAGFHQGRIWLNNSKTIPSFDQDTYSSGSQDWTLSALMCNVTGNAGAKGYSEVSGKEWQWQNYYGYVYDGEMWMEAGTTYTMGGNFDDGSAILIDGSVVWSQGNPGGTASGYNNWVAPRTFTPSTTGWHSVKLLVYDWEGGKNITSGALSATMWNTNGTTTASPQSDWSKFVDDGSGTLFRAKLADSYLSIDSVEQTASGFTLTVTSSAPYATTMTVYADATDQGETDTGWAVQSSPVAFDANETKALSVAWTDSAIPTFRVHLTGTDTTLANYGDFWEWSSAYRNVMDPTISAELTAVTGTSGTFDVTLGYDKVLVGVTPPALTLKAFYGAADAGATENGWDSDAAFTSYTSAGTHSCVLGNLQQGSVYYVRFAAKTAASDWVWTDCMTLSTAGPSLADWPASVYESDPGARSFTVTRPAAAAAEPLTVYLSYSANAASLASGLPASVEFAAGASEVTVQFTMIDNATADGDSSLVINIVPNAAYPVGNPVTATIVVVDDDSLVATECVWTGGGDGETWEEVANWTPRVPTIVDTAKFTSNGLTANKTVKIGGTAIIKDLLIETTTAFTLGTNGPAALLELGGITRADVEGTEGNHTISVPLVLYAGSETNCIWNVAGSNSLTINAEISKTAGTYVFKTGAGNVNMSFRNTTFTGPWIIREGQITANVNGGNTFKGTVTIGGGDATAKLVQSQKNSIAGKTYVHVYRNGSFESGDIDNGRVENIYVHEGGTARIGNYFYTISCDLWGGTYNGGGAYNAKWITSHASATTAVFNAYWRYEGYGDYGVSVERGTAPVDLWIKNGLAEGNSGKTAKKTGAGIVKSTANFNNLKNHFQINGGAWYVDNPSEYGLGIQETTVAAGAKLGGTGYVGMKDDKGVNMIALSNGSESNFATLSPGTIDVETGDLVYGTFTAGRSGQTKNNLSLGNCSHLEIGVGPKDPETKISPADKLFVNGNLVIGSNCTLDVMTKMAARDKLAAGNYTIVEADSISGTFATILRPSDGWTVAYESETVDGADVVKRIVLTVPPAETVILLR